MMTADLIHLDKIILVQPPFFFDDKWEKYCQINGWENQKKTLKIMGSERHTCITPWHYLNKTYAFKLFSTGSSAYDTEVYLGLPRTTADRYYKEFEAWSKNF